MAVNLYNQISTNKTKTYLVMGLFVVFVTLIGWLFGQVSGNGASYVLTALTISLGSAAFSYFAGDKMVLAMSGARPADKKQDFNFYTVSENLSIAAGLPMPKLYVIEDTAINAFATGRDPQHAIVCATRGALDRLDRSDLEGVIAHELSHVKNLDIRLMLIVTILVGTVAFLADMFSRSLWWGRGRDNEDRKGGGYLILIGIVLAVLSPIIAQLIRLAISRRREYLADASGVMLTRNPEGLADALEKISADKEVLEAANNATASLYIANPFKGKSFGAWFAGLFNTHPPIEERIKILRAMEAS